MPFHRRAGSRGGVTPPALSAHRPRRLWLGLLRLLLVALVLLPWALAVRANWGAARGYAWRVSLPYLGAALLVLLATMVACGVAWWWLLRRMGTHLPLHQAISIWLTAQMARYIPGPAWDVAGRAALCGRAGLDVSRVSVGLVVELATAIMAYATLVLVALPFWPLHTGDWGWLTPPLRLLPLLVPFGLLALYPPLLGRGVNLALRLLRRPAVTLDLSFRTILWLWFFELLLRVGEGLGFALFVRATLTIRPIGLPMLIGAHSAAWLVGFLAIFAPSGIGVREGVLAYTLTPLVPLSVGAAVAVGYRLCVSLRDLLAFALARAISRPADGAASVPAQMPSPTR